MTLGLYGADFYTGRVLSRDYMISVSWIRSTDIRTYKDDAPTPTIKAFQYQFGAYLFYKKKY
jgi:hypothetical protein